MIDLRTLIDCGIHPTQARVFQAPLSAAMALYDIDTPLRQAAFIAQCAHETARFVALEESFWYRDATRIATLFRTAFDVDHDGRLSAAEVRAAKDYVMEPERMANRIYAHRYGNGDEASGDGWRYRGSGLIHLTFLDNYHAAQAGVGRPYVSRPQLLREPEDACLSAAWFWSANACNQPADVRNIDAVTRKINPGMAGKDERRTLFAQALRAFRIH